MPRVTKQTVRKLVKRSEPQSAWPTDKGGWKVNLYGRSKTGKTTLWATFPKPIFAIVVSGGKKPGELISIDTREYRRVITPRVLSSTEQWASLLDEASKGYATIVLDHATGLQDLAIKEHLGLEEIPLGLYRAAGKGESWSLVTQQGWGQIALKMKELFRSLLNLDRHVVIVAQEREFNTESAGDLIQPYVASALTPSVVGWLNPAVDYIWSTFLRQRTEEKTMRIGKKTVARRQVVGGVEYCLRVGPDPVYTTGFRAPKGTKIPDVIVDPTFEKIERLIKEGG